MTYAAYEASQEGGAPISLFMFVHGNTEYPYTNHTEEVDHAGKTYVPAAIDPGKIVTSGDMSKNQLKIEIDRDTDLGALMRGAPPSKSVSLVVLEGHLEDPDNEYIASWSGLVLGSSRSGSKYTLTCDHLSAAIRGLGLGRDWQYTCPYRLYDTKYCQADRVAATAATAPLAISGRVLTLPNGWRGANDLIDYLHGVVEWEGGNGPEIRRIIKVSGVDDIKLGGAPHDIALSQSIDVILGCPKRSEKCDTLHNNIVNFGGQENIPLKNPAGVNNF